MTRYEELIFLLESFKNGYIGLEYFCSEFYRVYFDVKQDEKKIPHNIDKFMKELAMMCIRYSDDEFAPNAYYTEKDMITKIGCWGKTIGENIT